MAAVPTVEGDENFVIGLALDYTDTARCLAHCWFCLMTLRYNRPAWRS